MEEKQGNEIRAAELRNLCVQARAEELVGQSDLSPVAMFGIDSASRPVLTSCSPSSSEAARRAPPPRASVKDRSSTGSFRRAEREVVQAEPLFGVLGFGRRRVRRDDASRRARLLSVRKY